MRFKLTTVLGRALEVARSVLDDLDDDQVPAKLRPVVAHAGELTPPLASRLALELDRLDWLRERTLEAWPEADRAADGPDRASALYLARPEGWAAELARLAWETGTAAGSGASDREVKALKTLQRDLATARDKAKALQKELDAMRSELAAERRAARAPDRAARAAEAKADDALRAGIAARDGELAELKGRLSSIEAELTAAREDARVARKERAAADARLAEARSGSVWPGRGSIDLARHLDALMAQASGGRPSDDGGEGELPRLELPAGVRPDAAEAIDALRDLVPVGVIVDGYNAGLAFGEGLAAAVRARLEPILRKLKRLGGGGMTVTVVWDSALEEPPSRRPDGLDVRFAPPNASADDIVVAIAASSPRAVVITNDREVRDRSEKAGALALWSDALVAWERRR